MGNRSALIVATGSYQEPDLRQVRAPAQDASELAEVLADAAIGDFQVRQVIDQPSHQIAFELEDFFADCALDDLLLVHLSCPGIKDDRDRLFFAAANTQRRRLASTAVSPGFLNELMEACRARSIVLLLDCSFSAASLSGLKGGTDVQVTERFQRRGLAIVAASREVEYVWEGEQLTGAAQPSLFTAALVEGLRSGEADRDRDGCVSVTDLYSYVYERARASKRRQTPSFWLRGVEENLCVARTPPRALKLEPLPPEFQAALEHPFSSVRSAIVSDLEALLRVSDLRVAQAASQALEQLCDDDSRTVAAAAAQALRTARKGTRDIRGTESAGSDVNEISIGSSAGLPTVPSAEAMEARLRVFLCHSSADKQAVRQLYARLQADNIQPWIDEEDILPGQDWESAIRKAIHASHIILVCLSRTSITKAGYLQKEIKTVLEVADEQPEGIIFLIPVRLESCEVPDRLGRRQWVDLFEENGYSRLKLALRARAQSFTS